MKRYFVIGLSIGLVLGFFLAAGIMSLFVAVPVQANPVLENLLY